MTESDILLKARNYETETAKNIKEEERPVFHLTAKCGWMNDPNGFSFYNGAYHLFYQYNPYSTHWDSMHWGHAVSKDLLHWEYLPCALAPDAWYDRFGVFSGSAVETKDGKQLLMYTGVRQEKQADGTLKDVQVQCVATGDGVNYEKYPQNPVIDEKMLPKGASRNDFRDPRIWKTDDGSYLAVVANRPEDKSGQILLFASEDGYSWRFKSVLAQNRNRYGKMWECPDFFELDGSYVLLTSPQDMTDDGEEFHNGNSTLCLLGSFDSEKGTFNDEHAQTIDSGIDFYAPQTVLSTDGRRIMLGWLQNWDGLAINTSKKWACQMATPREIFIKDGRLCQKPIKELDSFRSNKISYENVPLSNEEKTLDGIKGRVLDMELHIAAKNDCSVFEVNFFKDEKRAIRLIFRAKEHTLTVDRKRCSSCRAIIHSQECILKNKTESLDLRIILDRFSMEVFIDDGKQAMSVAVPTDLKADGISFKAVGSASFSLDKYELSI